jgi:hypothetical protein
MPEIENTFDSLNATMNDLCRKIDLHCCLLSSLAEGNPDGNDPQALLKACPAKSREAMLRDAIREAIEVIEESRKAFKSKKLEALRKKLTDVLIESKL